MKGKGPGAGGGGAVDLAESPPGAQGLRRLRGGAGAGAAAPARPPQTRPAPSRRLRPLPRHRSIHHSDTSRLAVPSVTTVTSCNLLSSSKGSSLMEKRSSGQWYPAELRYHFHSQHPKAKFAITDRREELKPMLRCSHPATSPNCNCSFMIAMQGVDGKVLQLRPSQDGRRGGAGPEGHAAGQRRSPPLPMPRSPLPFLWTTDFSQKMSEPEDDKDL